MGPESHAAVPALVKMLGDETPTRPPVDQAAAPEGKMFPSPGFEAARTLAGMGGAALEPLAQAAQSPDAAVRARAVWALRQWTDPRGLVFRDAARDADPEVRAMAAGGLVQGLGVNPLGPLLDAVKDRDANVRRAAVGSLGQIPHSPRAADQIIRLMKADPDADVREAAAAALCDSGDPRAFDVFAAAVAGADPGVRSAAVQMFGRSGDRRAVAPLVAVLSDADPRLRMHAAASLGQIKDDRAVAPLAGLLADPDARVRNSAMDALDKITGQPFAADEAKWRTWWEQNKARYAAPGGKEGG
jgi:HEAT repeat protein